jgi:hypothetical protein
MAVLVHAAAFVVVLAVDGLVSLWVSPSAGRRVLTYWHQMRRRRGGAR